MLCRRPGTQTGSPVILFLWVRRCYCDDANEVLCRLEVRQVEKTKVEESARNIFYIIQGNEATPDELLHETAQKIIDLTTKYCGGTGIIIKPGIKESAVI